MHSWPQASIWVRAGKGDGPSAWMSWLRTRLRTRRGGKVMLWGLRLLTRGMSSLLPSEKVTVAWVQ